MRLLYNILFTTFFLLSAPWYLWKLVRRGNWRGGFAQRFGRHEKRLKEELAGRRVLWLHAVSVGEANLCAALVQALRSEFVDWEIVTTTTTTTGMAELRRQLHAPVRHLYYPVDFAPCVRATFNTLQPDAIILIETEMWPNLLWQAADRGIPVAIANARLSDSSATGYRRFGFLFRPLLAGLRAVATPNEDDREKWVTLGCSPTTVQATGNLKFDGADATHERTLDVPRLLRQLGVSPHSPVLVGGSTHEGEEALLARIWKNLRADYPDLLLILVPRHHERADAVAAQLRTAGMAFARRSQLEGQQAKGDSPPGCLLVDSTGELKLFLEVATIVFMGKSLTAHGGQNPIEPAALGRPVIFGPHMENFRGVVKTLLAGGAAVQVNDASELESKMKELLADEKRRDLLSRNAREVVRKNQGATQRTADMLRLALRAP